MILSDCQDLSEFGLVSDSDVVDSAEPDTEFFEEAYDRFLSSYRDWLV